MNHDGTCCFPHACVKKFLGTFLSSHARKCDRNTRKQVVRNESSLSISKEASSLSISKDSSTSKETVVSTSCSSNEGAALSRWSSSSSTDGDDEIARRISAGLIGACPPDRSADVSRAALDRAFEDIGEMRQWDDSLWKATQTIGAACGGVGRIDRMSCQLSDMEDVIVKQLPVRWLGKSPSEFRQLHTCAIELPWQDLCIMKHLNKLDFPYAIQLHGILEDSQNAYIMTSLAAGGDLFAWVAKEANGPSLHREELIRPIMKQVFRGVQWLHDLGIAHRDLSLENVVLTDGGAAPEVKIIDFGMAALNPRKCFGVRGKRSYQAPEMHESRERFGVRGMRSYDGFLTDAFALGVMLFSLASSKYPWKSTLPGACTAFDLVRANGPSTLFQLGSFKNKETGQLLAKATSAPFQSLLVGLLSIRPDERVTLGERCWEEEADAAELAYERQRIRRGMIVSGKCVRLSVWDSDWWDEDEE